MTFFFLFDLFFLREDLISIHQHFNKTTKSQTSQLIRSNQIERYSFFLFLFSSHCHVCITIKPLIGGGKKPTKMDFYTSTNLYAMSTKIYSIHTHTHIGNVILCINHTQFVSKLTVSTWIVNTTTTVAAAVSSVNCLLVWFWFRFACV